MYFRLICMFTSNLMCYLEYKFLMLLIVHCFHVESEEKLGDCSVTCAKGPLMAPLMMSPDDANPSDIQQFL